MDLTRFARRLTPKVSQKTEQIMVPARSVMMYLPYHNKKSDFNKTNRNITVDASVPRATETGEVVDAWFIFAHCSFRTGVVFAV